MEFFPDPLFVLYLKKSQSIIAGGFLYPKDNLYKFYDTSLPELELTALISHIDE
jgi:hypothetical protein